MPDLVYSPRQNPILDDPAAAPAPAVASLQPVGVADETGRPATPEELAASTAAGPQPVGVADNTGRPMTPSEGAPGPGLLTELGRGAVRGFHQTVQTGADLGRLVGHATGWQGLETGSQALSDEEQAKIDANPPTIASISEPRGIKDWAYYGAGAIGQELPMFAAMALPGGAAVTLGRAGVVAGGKALLERMIADGASKEVASAAANKYISRRIAALGAAGGFAGSDVVETGSIYGQTKRDTGVDAPLSSMLGGAAAATFDVMPGAVFLERALGHTLGQVVTSQLVKRLGADMASGVLMEGPTEGLQTIVENLTEQIGSHGAIDKNTGKPYDAFSPDNMLSAADAAVQGAMFGLIAGGASGVAGRAHRGETPPPAPPAIPPAVPTPPAGMGAPAAAAAGVPPPAPAAPSPPTVGPAAAAIPTPGAAAAPVPPIGTVPPLGTAAPAAGTRAAPVVASTAADVVAAGSAANAAPTDGQIAAGNYQKGHLQIPTPAGKLHGTIETTVGEMRRSKPDSPVKWEVPMPAPYGYVKATEGMDGEQVDAFFGPQPTAPTAYVIDQVNADTGKPDEHKAMIGFPSQAAAVDAYTQAFSDGRGVDRIGAVTPLPTTELRSWLLKGNTKAPLAPQVAEGVAPTNLPAAVAATGITAADVAPLAAQGQGPPQIAATLNDRLDPVDQAYLEAGRPDLAAAAKVAAIRSLMPAPNVATTTQTPDSTLSATSAAPAAGGEVAPAIAAAAAGVASPPEAATAASPATAPVAGQEATSPPAAQPGATATPKKTKLPAARRVEVAAGGPSLQAKAETAPAAVAPPAAGGAAAPAVGAVKEGLAEPKEAPPASRGSAPALKGPAADEKPVTSKPAKPAEKRAAKKAAKAEPARPGDKLVFSATPRKPGAPLPAERRAKVAEAAAAKPNSPTAKRAGSAKSPAPRAKAAPYTPADGPRNILAAESGKPDSLGRFFKPNAAIVKERVRKFLGRRKGTGDQKNRRMEFRDEKGVVVIGKLTPDDWVHRVETTMTPAEITAYRNWYPDTERIFRQLYGADWEMQRMAWLLGNVQASPRDAAMNALRAQEQEVTGNKALEAGVNDKFVRQLLRGEAPAGGAGQKILDFIDATIGASTRSIMGDDPRFGGPAPMDRHAMRDVGYVDGVFAEYLSQRFGKKALKAEVDSNFGSWSMPQYEVGAEHYRRIMRHLNDINFDGGGWTEPQAQAVGWRAISRLVSPSESAGAGSMQAILGNLHQLSFEAVPSPSAPMAALFAKYADLPFAQQRTITDKLLSDAMTMAREMTGVREVVRVYGTGGWTNPDTNVQSIAAGAQWKVLSSIEAPRGLAAILGYLAQQDAVFTSQPDPKGKTLALDLLQDDGGNHLADDLTVMAYWKSLADAEPLAGAGYHPISENGKPGIRLVLGEDTAQLRDRIEGLWQIARLTAQDMGFDVVHAAISVKSEMVSNDWSKQSLGEGYEGVVREAFGPGVSGRLVDHYGPQYETSVRAALATGKRSFSATAQRLSRSGELPGGAERVAASGGQRAAADALPGLPRKVSIPRAGISIEAGPFVPARDAAARYAAAAGLPYRQATHYLKVDPARATRIAAAFDAMSNNPADPLTKAAYAALSKETMAQWRAIQQTGLHVEFFPGDDPYEASPRLATEDVRNNNHLWVFSTDRGYGTTPVTAADIAANPLLAQSGDAISGQPARINDIFRIVHDYFGHVKEGVGFRADGEENAWASHALMYSPLARLAMTTETRGQNSWLNYGPHGEKNRTAATLDTVFADQKIGVLPSWVQSEGADFVPPVDVDQMRRETEAFGRWFGASKAVDANGDPLRVFHTRIYDFEAFDPSKQGRFTGHPSSALGFFFTPSTEVASEFATLAQYMKRTGENIVPAYLSIQKPFVMEGREYHDRFYKADRAQGAENALELRRRLDREGYDGIYVKPMEPADDTPLEFDHGIWVAFNPTQIKSTFNRGTFDPNDARIGFSTTPRQLADGDKVAIGNRTIVKNPDITDLHDLVKEAGYAPNSLGAILTARGDLLVTNGVHQDIVDQFGRSLGEHFTLIMVRDGARFGVMPTVAVDRTGDFREISPDEIREVIDSPALAGISTGLVEDFYSATPAAQQIRGEMRDEINRIVNRVTGGRVKVQFEDVIRPGPEDAEAVIASGGVPGQTVAGYADWEARIIGLAMGDPEFDPVNEAGHEAWHMIEFMGLVTPQEMAILRREEPALRALAAKEFNLPVDHPTIQQMASHEVRAIAFARYRRLRDMGKVPGLKPAVLRAFNRVYQLLKQVSSWVRGKGFSDFNTVFERANRGTIGARTETGEDAIGPASYSTVGYGPMWYSQLEAGLSDLNIGAATSVGWKEALTNLKKNGLKDEELDWSGLREWLDEQGDRRVKKDEVLAYVRANTPDMPEMVLGGTVSFDDPDAAREYLASAGFTNAEGLNGARALEMANNDRPSGAETSYEGSDTTFPGGENYRELLFHLPEQPQTGELGPAGWSDTNNARSRAGDANYTSSHFDDLGRNLVMHVRFDERTDAKGRRIIFVQEFQSDLHQAGRKRGYKDNAIPGHTSFDAWARARGLSEEEAAAAYWEPDNALVSEHRAEQARIVANKDAIPNAPFKKSWHEFLFKRMLRYAAQNGFDGLAWTAGSTQNERYKLSNHVDRLELRTSEYGSRIVGLRDGSVTIERDVSSQGQAADLVGSDVASKLYSTQSERVMQKNGITYIVRRLSGLDLDIGGTGMTGFYDKMLPTFAGKYAKKWGSAPERTTVPVEKDGYQARRYVGPERSAEWIRNLLEQNRASWRGQLAFDVGAVIHEMDSGLSFAEVMKNEGDQRVAELFGGKIVEEPGYVQEPAHVVPITDAMRESIVRTGQPLFSATPAIPASMPLTRDVFASVIANPDRNALSQQLKGATSVVPWSQKIQTALSFLKQRWADAAMQGMLDQYYILKKKEIGVRGRIDYTRSPWVKALMTNDLMSTMAPVMGVKVKGQWAGGALRYNAREGVAEINSNVKPFMAIFDPIAKAGHLAPWQIWAAAKRTQMLIAEDNAFNAGKPTNEHRDRDQLFKNIARQRGIGRDQLLSDLIRETEQPTFQPAMNDWTKLNKAMLDFAQQAGIVNAESRLTWERDSYVPFYRAIDILGNTKITAPGKGKGPANQSSGIRQLHGGAEQLNDLVTNMAMNLTKLTDASFKNMAAQAAIPILLQTGDLTRVPMSWRAVHVEPEQLAYLLESIGVQVQGMTQAQKDEYLRVFQMAPPKGLDILSVMVDGKAQYYRVGDPLAWKAMTNLGVQSFTGVTKWLGWTKRLLTHAVTLDPAFAIANGIRDSLSTWVITGEKSFVPFGSAAGGLRKALAKDGTLLSYMAAGGGGGGLYQTAPEDIQHKLGALDHRSVLTSPGKAAAYMGRLYHGYERVLAATEMANRLALYDKVVARGGSKAEATMAGKNILNFTMRGDWPVLRFLTETVPFLNARLQGLYVLGRAAKENPLGFALKGAAITAATMALFALNHDDQRWRDLEEWDKDTYYHIWLDNFFGKDAVKAMGLPSWMNHIRIPKPFEVGALFSTIPERAAALYEGEDVGRVTQGQALAMLTQTFAFNPIPQAMMPVIEQWANKSFFTGRPIVGIGLENLPAELQYQPTTSETARVLGGALGLAPVRLESLVRSYTGNLGSYILDASDMAVRYGGDYPNEPRLRVEDLPVVQRFFRDEPAVASKWLTEFYDQHTQIDQVWSGIREARRRGEVDTAMRLRTDNAELLKLKPQFDAMYKTITTINKAIRAAYVNRSLSPVAMRERIDQLTARRNDIVRRIEPRLRPAETRSHVDALGNALAERDVPAAAQVAQAMASSGTPPSRRDIVQTARGVGQPALADILAALPSSGGLPASVSK